MPWDFNVESQVNDFRNQAKSKGFDESEIEAFIQKKKPSLSIESNGNISIPQQPTPPEVSNTIPQIKTQEGVLPEVKQDFLSLPEPSFKEQALNKESQMKPTVDILGSIPDKLPDLNSKKSVDSPSIPATSGQNAELDDQQKIPAPSGSPSKVRFDKVIPEGYKFSPRDGASGLGGQCAWFSEQITRMPDGSGWTIGNSIQDKRRQLVNHIKNGTGFFKGKPKAGNTIVFDTGTGWGHVATINEIMSDGKMKLSESNWNNNLKVSHSRIIDPNDPTIMGYLKTVPNTGRK